ncbi:MAG: hypothetical protein R2939_08235 [Kofleriaceae bacterium]
MPPLRLVLLTLIGALTAHVAVAEAKPCGKGKTFAQRQRAAEVARTRAFDRALTKDGLTAVTLELVDLGEAMKDKVTSGAIVTIDGRRVEVIGEGELDRVAAMEFARDADGAVHRLARSERVVCIEARKMAGCGPAHGGGMQPATTMIGVVLPDGVDRLAASLWVRYDVRNVYRVWRGGPTCPRPA